MPLVDSGVVKLVGGVSCVNISDNISSVTCFLFGDAKLEKILNSRLKKHNETTGRLKIELPNH
jgi:hypothetical protein